MTYSLAPRARTVIRNAPIVLVRDDVPSARSAAEMTGWPVSLSMTVPLAVIVLGRTARNTAAATAAVTTSATGMIRARPRYHALRAAAGVERRGAGPSGGPTIRDMRT